MYSAVMRRPSSRICLASSSGIVTGSTRTAVSIQEVLSRRMSRLGGNKDTFSPTFSQALAEGGQGKRILNLGGLVNRHSHAGGKPADMAAARVWIPAFEGMTGVQCQLNWTAFALEG